jgi:hydrogenase maturation factor
MKEDLQILIGEHQLAMAEVLEIMQVEGESAELVTEYGLRSLFVQQLKELDGRI